MNNFGKPEEKLTVGKFRRKCEGNINIDIKAYVKV
jgi:hypothetical protein